MFTTNQKKKFDIQEANKHLQLLHERNAELLIQLDSKSGQLSKVEAQLEDMTKVKNSEVSKLTDKLSNTEAKLEEQSKETEQWKMLVHERDVMIAKLQVRCRQLEEMESKLYTCRPALEVLLGMIYNVDGSEVDSQTAAKAKMEGEDSEAGYAEPDQADSPDPPLGFLPSSETPSMCREESTRGVTVDRIQDFLSNSIVEYEKLMDINNKPLEATIIEDSVSTQNVCNDSEDTLNGQAKSVTDSGLGSAHFRPLPEEQPTQISKQSVDVPQLLKAQTNIFHHTTEFRVRDQIYPVVKL